MNEHEAMIECRHEEGDQLGPVCLSCGRVGLPDPTYLVLAMAAFVFMAHITYWIAF